MINPTGPFWEGCKARNRPQSVISCKSIQTFGYCYFVLAAVRKIAIPCSSFRLSLDPAQRLCYAGFCDSVYVFMIIVAFLGEMRESLWKASIKSRFGFIINIIHILGGTKNLWYWNMGHLFILFGNISSHCMFSYLLIDCRLGRRMAESKSEAMILSDISSLFCFLVYQN